MRDIDASREASTADDAQSRAGLGRCAFLRSAAVLAVVAALVPSGASAAPPPDAPEHARWRAQAAHVKITRDDWGVPHVVGKTDAHAVFGMIYAQAEDDFNRVERNYLVSLGRLAEAEGESALWQDLRQRLYLDHEELKALYRSSPRWLRELMDAWADGLNYFLATHPEVEPRVITRFEPWMALSFTEGSIGGDIERVSLTQLRAFYDNSAVAMTDAEREPTGSNGIAIAPSHTRDGDALLLINPHTSQ
jgi:acyl-homoserine-lactone acylase